MIRYSILFLGCVLISTASLSQITDTYVAKDSLVFKWGDSIEYNPNPANRKIERIIYKSTGCFGTCPIFNLTIDSVGNILFEAKGHNKSVCEGLYKQKLSNETFTELNNILNYINFAQLSDRYTIGMTDLPRALIDVRYQNGESKKVSDYGKNGTRGLRLLHIYMLELCYAGTWDNTESCQMPCDTLISRKELIEIKQLCPNGCLIPYSVDSILSYRIIIQDDDEVYWRPAAYRTPCLSRYNRLKYDFRKANRVTIDKLTVRNNGIIEEIDGWSYIVE